MERGMDDKQLVMIHTVSPLLDVFNRFGGELLPSIRLTHILDEPLLEVIFGRFNPVGKLPFELPSSMEAVRTQLEDVPFDSENPLFPYGFGLSYPEG